MSLIIRNVSAGNKLLLPNGRLLKMGCELKVNDTMLNSSLVRKLISEGKLTVVKTQEKASILEEVADVAITAVKLVAAASISPIAVIPLIPEAIEEIKDVIDVVTTEDTSRSSKTRKRIQSPKGQVDANTDNSNTSGSAE